MDSRLYFAHMYSGNPSSGVRTWTPPYYDCNAMWSLSILSFNYASMVPHGIE